MREILFRGKRTYNGKWVEGFYQCAVDKCTLKNHCYITTFMKLDSGEIIISGQLEVTSDTVGQYTGLTDKNGVKIFEGDILKSTMKIIDCDDEGFSVSHYDREDIGVVEWRKDGFMIAHKSKTWARSFYGCENYVIGNIHDNPELMEGGGGEYVINR